MKMTLVLLLLCVSQVVARDDRVSVARSPAQDAFDKLQREEMESNNRLKPGPTTNPDWQAYCKEYTEKFLAHAKKYPNDSSAVGALLKVIELSAGGFDPKLHKQTLALLRRDYLKTPLVVPSLRNLGLGLSQLQHDLLCEIGESNSSKRVRALAWRAIINGRSSYIRKFQPFLGTEEARKKQKPDTLARMIETVASWEKDIAEAKAKLQAPELAHVLADPSVGAKAPATVAVDLTGKKVSLAEHKGKVILLDFWETNCGPCKQMIPATNALIQEMKGRPFVAIAISIDESKDVVATFRRTTKMLGEQWWAGYDSMPLETWNVEAYPTIYLIDHEGIIRHQQIGYDAKTDKIAELVKELVKKAKAARQ